MPRPATGRTSSAWTCALLALVLSVTLSACRADPESAEASAEASAPASAAPERDEAPAQATLASHPVATQTRIHRVFGRLPDPRRKDVRRAVGRVVDGWWEASYLGGTYPRSSFPDAFPGFTRGAGRLARTDKALLTNQTGGPRIESVTPRRRTISVDIMAVGGAARSVTARFVLRFDTTGAKQGTTTVRGRLFLTRRSGPWRVFGYDVAKGSRP